MELSITIVFSLMFSVVLLGTLLLIPKVREHIKWKAVLPSLAIPFVIGGILYWSYAAYVTSDTEFFGGYGKTAVYYEDWNERVSCRHEIPCSHTKYCTKTCRDSNGSSYSCGTEACGTLHSNDGYYHSYDVDYHPPYWELNDSNGKTFDIGQDTFEKLAKRWNSRQFVDLNRCWGRIGCVHDNDGDKYVATYDGLDEHIETTAVAHTYENKIPVSNSLFRRRDVTPQEALSLGVYSYPEIHNYFQRNIIAPKNLGIDTPENEYYFQLLNAKLGRKKQVRCFLLVYKDKPASISFDQEAYWQNGNKNEIIITVGVDSQLNILWARAFSWSFDNPKIPDRGKGFEASIKNYIGGQQKLDIPQIGKWLYSEVENKFVRREFTPINKDLDVAYPFWLCLLCIILSNAITITLIVFPLAPYINRWYTDLRYGRVELKLFNKWRN
ncbi:MAG TPA: hypothetical protein PLP33_24815 [Leptospiraceae bacterium]|nr:hypothetical protein [Leptospiraceae bacterium]